MKIKFEMHCDLLMNEENFHEQKPHRLNFKSSVFLISNIFYNFPREFAIFSKSKRVKIEE